MNQEQKNHTLKLIEKKELEINLLLTEGHIPTQEGKKILNECKKLRKEVDNTDFNYLLVMLKYPEVFIRHKFLYHPDHKKEMQEITGLLK
jgi:hypothetical protein